MQATTSQVTMEKEVVDSLLLPAEHTYILDVRRYDTSSSQIVNGRDFPYNS